MSSSESDNNEVLRIKNRKRNDKSYKRNVIRNAKVQGLEHLNYMGNVVPQRSTGPNCHCKKACFDKLSQEDHAFCINKMNGFLTKNEQDIFLQQLMEKVAVKRHRPRKKGAKLKEFSFKYFTETSEKKHEVCKRAFTSIYGISDGRVRRLSTFLVHSVIPHDRRGQHPKANTKPPVILKKIHDHILSFPRKQTHYYGEILEYLDAHLNIKTMYSLFKVKYPHVDIKYQYYAKYFKENFSLRFGRPQVDTCIAFEEVTVKIESPSLCQNII